MAPLDLKEIKGTQEMMEEMEIEGPQDLRVPLGLREIQDWPELKGHKGILVTMGLMEQKGMQVRKVCKVIRDHKVQKVTLD